VIAGDDVDLPALGDKTRILGRHLRSQCRTGSGEIGVQPGLIRERADFGGLVLGYCKARSREAQRRAQQ
jgi:hypothetical protein